MRLSSSLNLYSTLVKAIWSRTFANLNASSRTLRLTWSDPCSFVTACLSYTLALGELGGELFEVLLWKFLIKFIFWPIFIIALPLNDDLLVTEFSWDPFLDLDKLVNFELVKELHSSIFFLLLTWWIKWMSKNWELEGIGAAILRWSFSNLVHWSSYFCHKRAYAEYSVLS